MIQEPNCYTRECKHYIGVGGKAEIGEYVFCKAFPDGIPDKIAYGDNLHLKPLRKQDNNIVYTRE
jgi:hypothetical protein